MQDQADPAAAAALDAQVSRYGGGVSDRCAFELSLIQLLGRANTAIFSFFCIIKVLLGCRA
jgi:hypothetical protein